MTTMETIPQTTDTNHEHTYYCPCCGAKMDVLIQPIEWKNPPTQIVMLTCWREGECEFATFTVSDNTVTDFDDLRKRYHIEVKFSPLTGGLLK